MRIKVIGCLLVLVCVPLFGQSWTPYDNFNGASIDATKWMNQNGICYGALDCQRQIVAGQLQMAIRGFGLTSTNSGDNFSDNTLYVTNPAPVLGMQAKVTVTKATALTCPANTGGIDGGHAILDGVYFNTGSGDSADDVGAFLLVDFNPYFEAPGTLSVAGFVYNRSGSYFNSVGIGTALVGETVNVSVQWNQPNHRFIFTLVRTGANAGTSQQSIVYSLSDTTPAASGYKSVGVRMVPANCTAQGISTDLQAKFDNVMIWK